MKWEVEVRRGVMRWKRMIRMIEGRVLVRCWMCDGVNRVRSIFNVYFDVVMVRTLVLL